MSYRLYGYFSGKNKSTYSADSQISDHEHACELKIEKKFHVSSIFSSSGVNVLFANPKNGEVVDETTAVVGFRGTDPAIDDTAVANFEKNGPGWMSYSRVREALFAEAAKEFEGKTTINITGHSFGGSVSQMFIADLLREIVSKKAPYSNIKAVNMVIFQSAGVAVDIDRDHNVDQLLENLNVDNPEFRFNMVAHCYEGDIIHASAPYILSESRVPSNSHLYLVEKGMTLWVFLTTLLRGHFFLPHSLPFYEDHGITPDNVLCKENKRAPIRVSASSVPGDIARIKEVYQADYMRFVSTNGIIHGWLTFIGTDQLKLIRDIIFVTLALSLFAIKLSAFIALPSLITYGVMLVALITLIQTVLAPSLEPTRTSVLQYFHWKAEQLSQLSYAASKFCSASSISPNGVPVSQGCRVSSDLPGPDSHPQKGQ